MIRKIRLALLCLPLALAGCAPSYIPAPVVNLEEIPAKSEKSAEPEKPAAPEIPPPPQAEDSAEPPGPAGPRPRHYTVRSGDTLAGIALNFGMSHRDIALWNGIANPDVVQVGKRLRLTPPPSQPVATALGGGDAGGDSLGLTESAGGPSGIEIAKAPGLAEVPADEGGRVLHPKTTIAGGAGARVARADSSGGVLDESGALVKTGPAAEGFVYSAAKLRELQTAWDARQEAKAESANAATALAESAAGKIDSGGSDGVEGVEGVEGVGGPESIRRAFGVEWSWPARGNLLSGFTDSSRGWDIDGESGDPVYAAADGKVIYAGSGIKGFGRLVIVKHNNDYLSAYAHNRRILMKEGSQVRRGELIAEMGDSGAERVKLHFEIRKAGKPTNPAEFLPEQP